MTLGSIAIVLGVAARNPEWWPKLLVIAVFVLLTNPVGSSTIARALFHAGVRPWRQEPSDRDAERVEG